MKWGWIWSGTGKEWAGKGDGMIGKTRGKGKEEREAGVGEWEGMGKEESVLGLRWGRGRKRRKWDKWLGMRWWEVGEGKCCAGVLRGWIRGGVGVAAGLGAVDFGLKNGWILNLLFAISKKNRNFAFRINGT